MGYLRDFRILFSSVAEGEDGGVGLRGVADDGGDLLLPGRPKTLRQVISLPVGSILPSPHQPRRDFDLEELDILSKSIAQNGPATVGWGLASMAQTFCWLRPLSFIRA